MGAFELSHKTFCSQITLFDCCGACVDTTRSMMCEKSLNFCPLLFVFTQSQQIVTDNDFSCPRISNTTTRIIDKTTHKSRCSRILRVCARTVRAKQRVAIVVDTNNRRFELNLVWEVIKICRTCVCVNWREGRRQLEWARKWDGTHMYCHLSY